LRDFKLTSYKRLYTTQDQKAATCNLQKNPHDTFCYFAAGMGANYCNQRVCMSACLSVGLSLYLYISKTARSNFTKFSVHFAWGRGSVLLWITLCFHIMGQIQIQGWSVQCSELFTVTRQVALLNCAPGERSLL